MFLWCLYFLCNVYSNYFEILVGLQILDRFKVNGWSDEGGWDGHHIWTWLPVPNPADWTVWSNSYWMRVMLWSALLLKKAVFYVRASEATHYCSRQHSLTYTAGNSLHFVFPWQQEALLLQMCFPLLSDRLCVSVLVSYGLVPFLEWFTDISDIGHSFWYLEKHLDSKVQNQERIKSPIAYTKMHK